VPAIKKLKQVISPTCYLTCYSVTGDKPELLYPEAAAELAAMGYSSTLDYVAAAAAAVLAETGLMPHVNAGVMGQQDIERWASGSGCKG
jgi:FO synthase